MQKLFVKKNIYLLPTAFMILSILAKAGMYVKGDAQLEAGLSSAQLLPVLVLEIFVVAAYLIPKTQRIGFFLLLSYLGGAIAVSFVCGKGSFISPSIVLALFWISEFLRFPALFRSNNAIQLGEGTVRK